MLAPSRRRYLTRCAAKLGHAASEKQFAKADPPGAAEWIDIGRLEAERRHAGGVAHGDALVEEVGDRERDPRALQPGRAVHQRLALAEVGEEPGVHLDDAGEAEVAAGAWGAAHRG